GHAVGPADGDLAGSFGVSGPRPSQPAGLGIALSVRHLLPAASGVGAQQAGAGAGLDLDRRHRDPGDRRRPGPYRHAPGRARRRGRLDHRRRGDAAVRLAGVPRRCRGCRPAATSGVTRMTTTQLRIPAVYMRGGTSKGVFFLKDDLPADPVAREKLLLRVIGSPDRYGKQTDGMGGATSSTSKIVILSRSARPGCDVDYLFGQVAIDKPVIDWTGNCGNLST